MAGAIESAVARGIMTTDTDFATAASGWRNEDGFLFAAHATAVVPGLAASNSNGNVVMAIGAAA